MEVFFSGFNGEGAEDACGVFEVEGGAFECALPAQAFGGGVYACE